MSTKKESFWRAYLRPFLGLSSDNPRFGAGHSKVVVGVDLRWASRSLNEKYPAQLAYGAQDPITDRQPELEQGTEMEDSPLMERSPADRAQGPATSSATGDVDATALDYLEKIFQVPFWLPPMDEEASINLIAGLVPVGEDGESEDSSHGQAVPPKILEIQVRPDEQKLADEDPRKEPDLSADAENGQLPAVSDETEGGKGTDPQPLRADETGAISQTEGLEPAEMLKVEFEEREFMLKLAGAIGKSPRRLKRFVNTYRILKAACTPLERKGFVLDSGRNGEYKAAMTLLAISTGAPPLAPKIFSALLEKRDDDNVSDFIGWLCKSSDGADVDDAADALKIYSSQQTEPAKLKELRYWAVRVSRFSFRSGRLYSRTGV